MILLMNDLSTYGFENGVVEANVLAWHKTGTTNKTSANATHNATIQVGSHHDVELLRLADLQTISTTKWVSEGASILGFKQERTSCMDVLSTIIGWKTILG